MSDLADVIRASLATPVPDPIREFAAALADGEDVRAVLFYGSNLRTGSLDGVLDFYVLTAGERHGGVRGWIDRRLWPEVGFRQTAERPHLQAKVAMMPLATFARVAGDGALDTTIWARFIQPCALVWVADDASRSDVESAIAAAAVTAARYAAVLGPEEGAAASYWGALFAETYRAELRVERPGRERQILAHDPERYAALLPLAWAAGGIAFDRSGDRLSPRLTEGDRRQGLARWRRRRRWGKALNIARLVKAAFTFEGAARYAAWKIERHTGMTTPLTPWMERHPVLAAPRVLWRLWRWRRGQRDAA